MTVDHYRIDTWLLRLWYNARGGSGAIKYYTALDLGRQRPTKWSNR